METSTQPTQTEAGVSGSAPMYVNPQPLNYDLHKGLGLKEKSPPWGFAAGQHFVPLLVGEFPLASLSYPIIFAGPEYTPLAILGINAGENLFFETNGNVRADAYLPAYIRRYPFTVASDEAMGRMVVCIDVGSDLIKTNPDHPLFNADGQPSEYTQRCIEFCQQFDADRKRTESFIQQMRDLDLFEEREQMHTPINPDGSPAEPVRLAGYSAVSEAKLNALPDAKFLELKANGSLAMIYAHLLSLANWERLVALTMERTAQRAAVAGNA